MRAGRAIFGRNSRSRSLRLVAATLFGAGSLSRATEVLHAILDAVRIAAFQFAIEDLLSLFRFLFGCEIKASQTILHLLAVFEGCLGRHGATVSLAADRELHHLEILNLLLEQFSQGNRRLGLGVVGLTRDQELHLAVFAGLGCRALEARSIGIADAIGHRRHRLHDAGNSVVKRGLAAGRCLRTGQNDLAFFVTGPQYASRTEQGHHCQYRNLSHVSLLRSKRNGPMIMSRLWGP